MEPVYALPLFFKKKLKLKLKKKKKNKTKNHHRQVLGETFSCFLV